MKRSTRKNKLHSWEEGKEGLSEGGYGVENILKEKGGKGRRKEHGKKTYSQRGWGGSANNGDEVGGKCKEKKEKRGTSRWRLVRYNGW